MVEPVEMLLGDLCALKEPCIRWGLDLPREMEQFWGHFPSNCEHTHTHTHPFNGPLSGTTQVSRYQKGKTYLDFTEARDSEW